jgi:hypothetical protein
MKNIKLSKTDYLEGLRCPKLFWLRRNRPELAAAPDAQTEYLFATGHRVEEYARQMFPGGVLIGSGPFSHLLAETENAMASDALYLYEATFANDQMVCRTDVLHRWDERRWNLGEVKMCTQQKPEHVDDIAFQVCCLQGCGHPVERCHLIHINRDYTRHGGIDPHALFAAVDLTREVKLEVRNIPDKVKNLIRLARETVAPNQNIGSHCKSPGRCPFYGHCHADIPSGSIYELPYANKIIPFLLARGIHKLEDIPLTFPLSQRQAALVQSARTRQPVVNTSAIKECLKQFNYPHAFLDFETINFCCVPPYEDSSPFERLPFQFSVHIQRSKDEALRHFQFLPETSTDPRLRICEELIEILGDSGSVIAWNAPFEISVLKCLAKRFPQYSGQLNSIISRVVDLIVPFRSGAYTDYRFCGSASLKKVLPILVPSLTYTGMAINRGDDASLCFQRFVDGKITNTEWASMRRDLLAYCELDTKAMVRILDYLLPLQ